MLAHKSQDSQKHLHTGREIKQNSIKQQLRDPEDRDVCHKKHIKLKTNTLSCWTSYPESKRSWLWMFRVPEPVRRVSVILVQLWQSSAEFQWPLKIQRLFRKSFGNLRVKCHGQLTWDHMGSLKCEVFQCTGLCHYGLLDFPIKSNQHTD